jgi:ATP-dependent Lon protease
MDGITIDLSHATFIFSFNDKNKICPILLDRMEIIKFHSYSTKQKKYITEHYLLPKVITHYYGTRSINIKFINKNNILNLLTSQQKYKMQKKYKYNNKKLNIHNIIPQKKHCIIKNKCKYSGLRYINHRLERLIAKININILEKQHIKNNNTNNKIIINTKIVNSIL